MVSVLPRVGAETEKRGRLEPAANGRGGLRASPRSTPESADRSPPGAPVGPQSLRLAARGRGRQRGPAGVLSGHCAW